MHKKFIVDTARAPRAMGPFSQAVGYGALLFVSGQIALDPHTGKLNQGGIESQTRQVMDNIQGILMGAGLDLSHVLSVTIYLRNLNDFEIVNDVYNLYFDHGAPARSVVEVTQLPQDALIQVDAICTAPANYEALADEYEDEYPDYDPTYGDDGTGPDSGKPDDVQEAVEVETKSDVEPEAAAEPVSEEPPGLPGTVQAATTLAGGFSPVAGLKLPAPGAKKDEPAGQEDNIEPSEKKEESEDK